MMGRHMDLRDARDTTLLNARRAITQVASTVRLPPLYVDRAYRLYQLALQRSFIFGRRQAHVVATCLYIVCRQEKSPHLLIDFADALQVNVYVLGKSFLQFTRVLNINLPVVDPSLYIHRYATQLDLGDKMNSIVTTSLRIITRLKKDWIVIGRRPDGICAAAMLIASRAHGIDVTQDEIAQIFRIANDTIRKRLLEFSSTPAAQLSLHQFHTQDISLEFDPPSFIRNIVDQYGDQITVCHDVNENDEVGEKMISAADLEADPVYGFNETADPSVDAVLVLPNGTHLGVVIPKVEESR
jgi:transcription factor IIIB subunit 2